MNLYINRHAEYRFGTSPQPGEKQVPNRLGVILDESGDQGSNTLTLDIADADYVFDPKKDIVLLEDYLYDLSDILF